MIASEKVSAENRAGERVLLVEDSPVQAREIQLILQQAGFIVEVAPDAEQGLARLAKQSFDLVLSDLQLPGASGFDVCRRVKEGGSMGPPVMLMTRWGDPLNVLLGLEAGADGFVNKGQAPAEIITRVRRAIARRSSEIAVAEEPTRVVFLNKEFELTADRQRLFEVLLSGFEDTVYLKEKLEQEVQQRLRAEEELKKYANELKRSNREFEQFAYVVSHDLKEPLRMVSGYAELLAGECGPLLNERAQSCVQWVTDGARRMARFIDDLLNYSQVGRGQPCLDRVNLDKTVENVLGNLQVAIREAQAEVVAHSLPEVFGNQLLLMQLLQNLVGNALKFRGSRPPRVTICGEEKHDRWIISVTDNGIGIPRDQQDRVFEVFQRLHTRQEYDGTGIGLAVCKKIAEQHGGRIWIESEVGQGTAFFVEILKPSERNTSAANAVVAGTI